MYDVLVVEDDDLLRAAMVRVLGDPGYRVAAAANPQQAIAWLESSSFRLVVCDLGLPGPGTAASVARMADAREIPFIVASGMLRIERMCAGWTVAEILEKPFGGEELLAAVERNLAPLEAGQSASWGAASSPNAERSSAFEWTPSLA